MVFGNLGDDSGTGVAFTRDPATGENVFYGEFLMNAQGEDVVAGIRTPQPISELERENCRRPTSSCSTIRQHAREALPRHAGHRVHHRAAASSTCCSAAIGKRTGFAAVRIAVDMVDEKLITTEEALLRVEPERAEPAAAARLRPGRQEARPIAEGRLLAKGLQRRPRRRHRHDRLPRRGRRGAGRPRARRVILVPQRDHRPRTSAA